MASTQVVSSTFAYTRAGFLRLSCADSKIETHLAFGPSLKIRKYFVVMRRYLTDIHLYTARAVAPNTFPAGRKKFRKNSNTGH